MADISSIQLPSGNTYDVKDILGRQSIPYGIVTSDSTTVFTATVDGVTQLSSGVCCLIRNNNKQTSASGWTLNVNDLGAKPVYNNMADATRDTTIFNKVYTMLFIYDEDRVDGGCWVCYRGYNTNDNTIGYQIRHNSSTLVVTQKTYRYRLLFSGVSLNTLVPANTSSSTSATAVKTVNSTPINPFGPIYYYGYTSAVNANASPSAVYLWQQYAVNLGYSFTNATALDLTSKLPVFLKCAPQNDGSAIIDSTEPIVQALPSSADGKIYILLGIAYSATNLELCIEHPVFYYDGTATRIWTGASGGSSSVAWNDITGKPAFATVATSGSYNDLSNKPTIPADLWEQGVDSNNQPVPGAIKAKDFVDTDDVSRTNSAPWTGALVAGGDNTSTGTYSVIAGRGNTANSFSTTIGDSNTAAGGGGSTLFGNGNQATSGSWGFAAGWDNTISHNNTVAMGAKNTASNYQAVALGYQNISSGYASGTLGNHNTASGSYGIALGYQNTASGYASVAVGRDNISSGQSSYAEGRQTTASGSYSHSEGSATQAIAKNNHVFGAFNVPDSGFTAATERGTYIEIVGNGADAQNLSNARTLDWSGNEWVAGLVSVGASASPPTPTANNHLTTKKYVDDIVGNIETLLASI